MNFSTRLDEKTNKELGSSLTFKTGKTVTLTPEEKKEFERWVIIRQQLAVQKFLEDEGYKEEP